MLELDKYYNRKLKNILKRTVEVTENEDKIKDLFSGKLKNYEPEVPASLWDRLEESLPESEVVPTSPLRKKFYLRTIATVASIAAALLVVFYMTNITLDTPETSIFEIAQVLESPAIDNIPNEQPSTVESTPRQMAKNNTVQVQSYSTVVSASLFADVEDRDSNSITETENTDLSAVSEEQQSNVAEEPARKITSEEAIDILMAQNEQLTAKNNTKVSPKHNIDNFSMGLASSANMLSSGNKQINNATFSTKSPKGQLMGVDLYQGESKSEMKHDQPVSFGLTVSKGIAPNLSVETGIVYTYLSSSIETTGNYEMRQKQKFHYLGVPLNLNYTFYRNRRFSTYLSVGGMIQKDVKGTYKGGLYNNSEKSNFAVPAFSEIGVSRSIKQDHPQLSVQTSLGASYRIYNRLSVQGRVGAAYYFDASNEYRTVYSDRDLQLDVNIGLRWDF